MRKAVLAAVALWIAPAAASAITLLSQSREVHASAGHALFLDPPVTVGESESASDFSPFSGAADAEVGDAALRLSASSSAAQISSIVLGPEGSLETLISGSVEGGAGTSGARDAFASGRSVYLLTFELTSEQPYEMVVAATVTESGGISEVLVELTRNGSERIERMLVGDGGLDTDTSGLLDAGTYSLRVDASAGAVAFGHSQFGSGGGGGAGFDVMLRVPEPRAAGLLVLAALVALVARGRVRRAPLVAVALLAAPAPASSLSVLSQSRDVHARAESRPFFEPDGEIVDAASETATDFSPFSGTVDANVGVTSASATQASSVGSSSGALEARSSGDVGASARFGLDRDGLSSGGSDYLITFELTGDQPFELNASATSSLSRSPFPASRQTELLIELTRDGGDVVERIRFGGRGELEDAIHGVLGAGAYSLRIEAEARANVLGPFPGIEVPDAVAQLTFDVTLRVLPEPEAAALLLLGACAFAAAPRARRSAVRRTATRAVATFFRTGT